MTINISLLHDMLIQSKTKFVANFNMLSRISLLVCVVLVLTNCTPPEEIERLSLSNPGRNAIYSFQHIKTYSENTKRLVKVTRKDLDGGFCVWKGNDATEINTYNNDAEKECLLDVDGEPLPPTEGSYDSCQRNPNVPILPACDLVAAKRDVDASAPPNRITTYSYDTYTKYLTEKLIDEDGDSTTDKVERFHYKDLNDILTMYMMTSSGLVLFVDTLDKKEYWQTVKADLERQTIDLYVYDRTGKLESKLRCDNDIYESNECGGLGVEIQPGDSNTEEKIVRIRQPYTFADQATKYIYDETGRLLRKELDYHYDDYHDTMYTYSYREDGSLKEVGYDRYYYGETNELTTYDMQTPGYQYFSNDWDNNGFPDKLTFIENDEEGVLKYEYVYVMELHGRTKGQYKAIYLYEYEYENTDLCWFGGHDDIDPEMKARGLICQ